MSDVHLSLGSLGVGFVVVDAILGGARAPAADLAPGARGAAPRRPDRLRDAPTRRARSSAIRSCDGASSA